mgnify:CR=1 FL=1
MLFRSDAISFAAAIAAGFGQVGVAISGGGADANNVIQTSTRAFLDNSSLASVGKVDVDAINSARIDARIVSAAFALAIGSSVGVGASIGVAIARNDIGYKSDDNYAATYTTASNPSRIVKGNTVRIASGANAGAVFRYIGDTQIGRAHV